MAQLPTPVTTTEMYLSAVLQELKTLNALLQPTRDDSGSDSVDLIEQAAKKKAVRKPRGKA